MRYRSQTIYHAYRDCVVDKVKGQSSQIANTQLQVIEYTWTSGGKAETTDAQCICAYKLLRQLINGTVPDLICDASSPILCTKFCKQWSSTNGSGIGTCNSETTCEFNCIMRTTFPMNGTQVYALFTGLGCTVLKGHIQDICRILIGIMNIYIDVTIILLIIRKEDAIFFHCPCTCAYVSIILFLTCWTHQCIYTMHL